MGIEYSDSGHRPRQLGPVEHWCCDAPRLVWLCVGRRSLARPRMEALPQVRIRANGQLGPRPVSRLNKQKDSMHSRPHSQVHDKAIHKAAKSTRSTSQSAKKARGLRVIRERVAGIDLGAREHWVCCPGRDGQEPQVRTFRTTTPQLERLADWLEAEAIESVAMESTGIYWIPLYELLQARGIEVVLVNARQLSHVPGRKSDMIDCQWLQLLHSCGLLRGSFRPTESICELRSLERERAKMVREAARKVQWMQKSLDQMNVQVHRALSDLTGKSGLRMVRAIVEGERDPAWLAAFRDKRCKKSEAEIASI